MPSPFEQVLTALRCPVCREQLRPGDRQLRCTSGHSFDLARQGYVNLTAGSRPATGDSAAMVLSRERFLAAGHYAPIARRVAELARGTAPLPEGLVIDLAGGTGYYLATALDALPPRAGICLDLSAAALRRAARAHPRAVAIGADAWARLPLADGAVALALNVFGPRDPAELQRVLAPGGVLVTVSPRPDHLAELVGPLGMIGVDPAKDARRSAAFARFARLADGELRYDLELAHADITDLAGMGPSAVHTDDAERSARVAELPARVRVTVAVRVSVYAN